MLRRAVTVGVWLIYATAIVVGTAFALGEGYSWFEVIRGLVVPAGLFSAVPAWQSLWRWRERRAARADVSTEVESFFAAARSPRDLTPPGMQPVEPDRYRGGLWQCHRDVMRALMSARGASVPEQYEILVAVSDQERTVELVRQTQKAVTPGVPLPLFESYASRMRDLGLLEDEVPTGPPT